MNTGNAVVDTIEGARDRGGRVRRGVDRRMVGAPGMVATIICVLAAIGILLVLLGLLR